MPTGPAPRESAPPDQEPAGLLPAPEKVGAGAGETHCQQSEGESDVADRFDGTTTVMAKL